MKKGVSDSCSIFFTTLSNPTRLAILELLRKEPKTVTEISDELNQEQSMISHNLRPLVRCGFVFVEKRWKERIYSLNNDTIEPVFEILIRHFNKYCVPGSANSECKELKHKI
ncbi:MAG TPA: metalloregulator ArsR/SmtB family transcription factor [Nitrososphaerales archaeon]